VLVIADAENRSKTLAYQTVSGDTTKGAFFDTLQPTCDHVQAMTAVKGFFMDCSKSDGHHCIWYYPAPNTYTEQNDKLMANSLNSSVLRRAET
jgi:hypothetical protein